MALDRPTDYDVRPLTPLRYPGTDPHGTAWRSPPTAPHPPSSAPAEVAPVIAVVGSSGFKASWQAGAWDAANEVCRPVRVDTASGGTIPGLAMAAGLHRRWWRTMNAGAPSEVSLTRVPGLRWFERANLDLAGVYELTNVERWLADWLAWAGVRTFRDLRYAPDEPRPPGVAHRAGVCVVMWRTHLPYPRRCTAEELADPLFVRSAFRWAFYGRQFPFRRFRQVWIPDTVAEHLPWLADEIDDHSPAWWARVSMSQWPACVPTVLQDPRSLHLVFLTDGGHIDNQPSLFNDGQAPAYPLLNLRLMQSRRRPHRRQSTRDGRRMPFGRTIRFAVTPETRRASLTGHDLTWELRDAMYRRGFEQVRDTGLHQIRELVRMFPELCARAGGCAFPIDVPVMHGFQLIAAARRPHVRRVWGFRS